MRWSLFDSDESSDGFDDNRNMWLPVKHNRNEKGGGGKRQRECFYKWFDNNDSGNSQKKQDQQVKRQEILRNYHHHNSSSSLMNLLPLHQNHQVPTKNSKNSCRNVTITKKDKRSVLPLAVERGTFVRQTGRR